MIRSQGIHTGYQSEVYLSSLSDYGYPLYLEHCQGWLLRRPIAGGPEQDAMGAYPLFSCNRWEFLPRDLEEISSRLVSVTLVADPFGGFDGSLLKRAFPDRCQGFKEHYVTDLRLDREDFVSGHHRRYARWAGRRVEVEKVDRPDRLVETWSDLYENLIRRHRIQGLARFSKKSFHLQLQVPGLVAFRAMVGAETVGMVLWFINGDVAYYHLGAYSDSGYNSRASFAIFWNSIRHFASAEIRWLNLGAGSGLLNDESDGLARFKKGWASGTRTAYLCGRIFDRQRYEFLKKNSGQRESIYFPAYRAGEFQ